MKPRFLYKIYDISDTFVTTLNDVMSEPMFTYSINGGLGQVVLELDRSLEDYGEGSDIDFNYKVEIYITDDYNDNVLIYTGFISKFSPYYLHGKEGVEMTILPNIAKLNNEFYRSGDSVKDDFSVTWTTTEIADIIEGILTNHRSLVSALYISNDYTNIGTTGNSITITFNQSRHITAIKELEKYLDNGWFWYIDAEGKFHLKEQSATADHSLVLGKHIIEIDGQKNIEDVINTYFIWNGERSGTVVDNLYEDATSITNFDRMADILVDFNMTTDAMSNITGNRKIAKDKDSKRQITVVVSGEEYDIMGIRPGDTCKVLNIDASQTLFGDNMVIHNIDYRGKEARLELIEKELKPVLSTESKAKNIESVNGVTAEMVKEATLKANAGMYWDEDTLVIEGSISAVTGSIGGWEIGTNTLSSADEDILLRSETGNAALEFYDISGASPVLSGKIYGQSYAGMSTLMMEANATTLFSDSGLDVQLVYGTDNGSAGISYIEHVSTGLPLGSLFIGADLDRGTGADIVVYSTSLRPMTATSVNLGDASNKWNTLYLDQLSSGYPTTEGALFTKTDHKIYYYNGSSEVQLGEGISEVKDDTSPQLGGNLDCQNTYKVYNLISPVNDKDAATKEYADDLVADYLPLSGGTMTGAISMNSLYLIQNLPTPINDGDAARKKYVDDLVADYLPLSGGSMTGGIDMGGNGITDPQYIAFDSTDTTGLATTGTLIRWNSDNNLYYYNGAGWDGPINGSFLPLSGGTMTGSINMGTNNITNAGTGTFAGKLYADHIQVGSNFGVGVCGIDANLTMNSHQITGLITPTSNDHAVNKEYVDDNFLPLAGGSMDGNRVTDLIPVLENLASNPGSPVNGLIYYNTTDGEAKIYLEGSWWRFDLTLSS
jgi:hypothetical protein